MNTLYKHIKSYADQFETKEVKRHDENEARTIVVLKPDHDEALQNSIREAHQGLLPHDWIYDTYNSILENLTNYTLDSLDDLEEYRHEIVDGLVDVYTYDLTAWLHSSNTFQSYLDQAVQELDAKENILMVAQYLAIDEIYTEVVNFITNTFEE